MRICSVEDCDKKHYGKGFCYKHYRKDRAKLGCYVENCNNPMFSRNLCFKHYYSIREDSRSCSVNGCDKLYYAKGFCRFHWNRKRKKVPIDKPKKNVYTNETCRHDGCTRESKRAGFCFKHYSRHKKGKTEQNSLFILNEKLYSEGFRICGKCLEKKYLAEYYFNYQNDTYRTTCKECYIAAERVRRGKPNILTNYTHFGNTYLIG